MPNNYGAIELGICENTSLALNEALGVSTGFKPSEWAENISGLVAPTVHLEEGEIASFTNGLAVPYVSVTADINAVQSGSGTPSPDNIRPISGISSVNVKRTGKNLLNGVEAKDYALATFSTSTSGENTTGRYYTLLSGYPINNVNLFPWLKFKSNTAYTFIAEFAKNNTAYSTNIQFVYSDGTFDSISRVNTSDVVTESEILVATSNSSKTLVGVCGRFQSGTSYLYYDHMGVFEGTVTDNSYEPYTGEVKNIPLNQTVYGGRLNATTGELTITHAIVDMGSLAWAYNSSANVFWAVISDMKRPCNLLCEAYIQSSATNVESMADYEIWNRGYAYNDKNIVAKNTNYSTASDFKTSVTGVHLVYELATPITVQLTPTQIEGLLGTNNVWADTGDIEVVYKGKSARSDISFTSAVTSGWTATNGERDMLTITAITDAVVTFNQTATGITNCGSNHAYEKITVNGVEKWRRNMPTNTSQTFNDIPVINLNKGDVMALTFGFTNYHSNINMNFVGGKIDIVGGVSFRGITGVTNTSTTII